MDSAALYDSDILAWSEQQAAVLRDLKARRDLPNQLDLEHVADEIADVGQGELREVRVLLGRALAQLVVAWAAPDVEPAWTWTARLIGWLGEAELRFTPAMRECLDLNDLWRSAVRQAIQRLEVAENAAPVQRATRLQGSDCPFSVDCLLGDGFQIKPALARLESIQAAPAAV